jgi:hypothetical protein
MSMAASRAHRMGSNSHAGMAKAQPVSANILAHILLDADLTLKRESITKRITDAQQRLSDLDLKDPKPTIAIDNVKRSIQECMVRCEKLVRDAAPFVEAVERALSETMADDLCRRYYLSFGGSPEKTVQIGAHKTALTTKYNNVSLLALQSYARKIAALMSAEVPLGIMPLNSLYDLQQERDQKAGRGARVPKRRKNDDDEDTSSQSQKHLATGGLSSTKAGANNKKRGNLWCAKCEKQRIIDTASSAYVCPICGGTVDYLDNDNKNWSFGKRIQLSKPLGYEHVNHFRKLLMQIQAKERYVVDRSVIESLSREFASGVQQPNNAHINIDTIKEKLSKLGQTDLYCHRWQIEGILTNREPVVLTVQQERLLIKMFHQHRQAFEIYKTREEEKRQHVVGEKKTQRVNLLYYSYLLGKFAEILEDREKARLKTNAPNIWTQVRMRVSRLKSQQCVQEHDMIHRNVCKILGPDWTFKESTSSVAVGNSEHNLSKYAARLPVAEASSQLHPTTHQTMSRASMMALRIAQRRQLDKSNQKKRTIHESTSSAEDDSDEERSNDEESEEENDDDESDSVGGEIVDSEMVE